MSSVKPTIKDNGRKEKTEPLFGERRRVGEGEGEGEGGKEWGSRLPSDNLE